MALAKTHAKNIKKVGNLKSHDIYTYLDKNHKLFTDHYDAAIATLAAIAANHHVPVGMISEYRREKGLPKSPRFSGVKKKDKPIGARDLKALVHKICKHLLDVDVKLGMSTPAEIFVAGTNGNGHADPDVKPGPSSPELPGVSASATSAH